MQQIKKEKKISTEHVPRAKSVSRGGKSMYKFYEEKNQRAISFTDKISIQPVSRTRSILGEGITMYQFQDEKIEHETSFTKKISTQQGP